MPKAHQVTPKALERRSYEFGGPLGAFATSFGLPVLCYILAFTCNDISGCPTPSILHPSTLTLEKLIQETGWPGIWGLGSFRVTGYVLLYYLLSLVLNAVLPGAEVEGTILQSGGRLKYRFNALTSALATCAVAIAGTVLRGHQFPLWTFIWGNQVPIMTANLGIAVFLASYAYIESFSVKANDPSQRELAVGGHSGNIMYDWFLGRELNPRVTLPLLGSIDIKTFVELRPGLLGWVLLNCAFMARQYETYGLVTDSMILAVSMQGLYVFDSFYNEASILTTMDITTDGFGFMLSYGNLAWVPFLYSIQARYLAVHPIHLGLAGVLTVIALQAAGFYIFRAANSEKNAFRTNPTGANVAHLRSMSTRAGTKLLISGWWGRARHINYLGDLLMACSYCLPTAVAGYVVEADGSVVPGEARGWGMLVTYFYLLYMLVLLVHREGRDEEKCRRKYGDDWDTFKRLVPWRILPGIY